MASSCGVDDHEKRYHPGDPEPAPLTESTKATIETLIVHCKRMTTTLSRSYAVR